MRVVEVLVEAARMPLARGNPNAAQYAAKAGERPADRFATNDAEKAAAAQKAAAEQVQQRRAAQQPREQPIKNRALANQARDQIMKLALELQRAGDKNGLRELKTAVITTATQLKKTREHDDVGYGDQLDFTSRRHNVDVLTDEQQQRKLEAEARRRAKLATQSPQAERRIQDRVQELLKGTK